MSEKISKQVLEADVSAKVKKQIEEANVYKEGITIARKVKSIKDILDIKEILRVKESYF
jgi:hypothetical protein